MAIPTPELEHVNSLSTGQRPRRFGFRWVILGMLFLAITLNYIDRLVVGFVFTPEFKAHFGITPDLYGYISGAFAISYACGQLFSGWMLDKIGTRIGYSL